MYRDHCCIVVVLTVAIGIIVAMHGKACLVCMKFSSLEINVKDDGEMERGRGETRDHKFPYKIELCTQQ